MHPLFPLRLLALPLALAAAFMPLRTPADLETFLHNNLGFTALDLSALEKGQIIVKLPETAETREVAAFAITRLDVSPAFFVDRIRDIARLKKSDNVLQIGKFSNPPKLEDLANLTLDPAEIESIKRCQVERCGLKMSAEFMQRFRKEVNWSAPGYRARATALMREMLLKYVETYLREGNAALGEYRDKTYTVRLSDEMKTLLQPARYMYGYAPEFQKYLQEFPHNRPAETEDFVYWSMEKVAFKPVVSMTHVTIYKRGGPGHMDVLVASKGIYASHYFEASLGLTGFIQSESSQPARSYLFYVNRSRADALRGALAGMKRSLISTSLRDAARKNMEMIKQRLEMDYRK